MKIHYPLWSVNKHVLWLMVDEEYANEVGYIGSRYRDNMYGVPIALYQNNELNHIYPYIKPTEDELYLWELEASLRGGS